MPEGDVNGDSPWTMAIPCHVPERKICLNIGRNSTYNLKWPPIKAGTKGAAEALVAVLKNHFRLDSWSEFVIIKGFVLNDCN